MTALLEVTDLRVRFGGEVDALRGVSLALERGESLAIIGESGAGKSTLARGLVGLLQPPEATGSVRIRGQELVGADAEALRALRWETVAIGLQGMPFNPVATIGAQVAEPLRERRGADRRAAWARARELAVEVQLDPALLERHPHELSGGERRRATLAMALILDPELLVLDEPVAGLDPVGRSALLDEIGALASRRGFGLVLISHDLPAAARLATRCIVLYAGSAIEAARTRDVVEHPAHPYTAGLVAAYPVMSTTKDLRPIRGTPPDPRASVTGCAFAARCTQAEAICAAQPPALAPARGRLVACHFGGLRRLLTAVELRKTYRRGGREVRALDGVSLELSHGESLGIVGPSGSGKTTLARILAGLLDADGGELRFEPVATAGRLPGRHPGRRVQLVMQDPWDALSPRLPVEELVREPLDIAGAGDGPHRRAAVAAMLAAVGLPSSGGFLAARVHELSGGQLQRIALARALIARPALLVADEPTSMLDASEQARLLVVLRELQVQMGLALVLVSHDLALVRKATDRIVVLDEGRVAETGSSQRVGTRPASATGRRLLAAAPSFEAGEG
ncbi:MAG TPA: ABC transporter ATP-binding protein [Solirubrobacteraceae bacterium]|nr:ABC transporter ATP-binding protein [Solirubrobacteraceae bacterium]